MTFTKQNAEGKDNVFILTFEVTPEEFSSAVNKAYEKTKDRYSVAGFRKGKVPKRILEGMYGKGLFYEDALDIIMPEYYEKALTDEKLDPIEHPDVDVTKIGEDGVEFKITVTVFKPFTLGQYKGLTLKKAVFEVKDEDVEHELKHAQEHAVRIISADDRPAKDGDTVLIDYSGSVGGVKFKGGTAEKQELNLGTGSFIPGFEEQVAGMSIGETKDLNVKFPDDYHAEELKGKEAVFTVKLHEIKYKEYPAIDDEFAKEISEFDTLEAYKADIRKNIEKENQEKAKNADEKAIIEKVAENTTDMEIPDSFVDKEVESMLKQFEYRLMYQGLKMKDFYAYTGQSEDDVKASYRDAALKAVKARLIMEEIIKTEDIKLDTDKLDEKLKELAERDKTTVEEYKAKMNHNEFDYFANEILTGGLFDFLFANNKFE
ncbi:MAG: trigger factor [Clostridiales bacterium]|jgi:trigger factor|nr:trigger factor [Clostridiales bacterium]